MIGPCDPCSFRFIALGHNFSVEMCEKCHKLRLRCPHCGGKVYEDHRYAFKEYTCVRCQKTTSLVKSWG